MRYNGMYKHDNGIVTWTQKKSDGLLILNNTSRPPPSILVLLASAISCDIKYSTAQVLVR